jgi:hypothetical protein
LNWLQRTRPCLSYGVARLASNLSAPTYKDAQHANAIANEQREQSFAIRFAPLQRPLRLLAYGDASFCRNNDGTSQGGYAAVLTGSGSAGQQPDACLLEWSSAKIRRICRSTLGAELLVTVGATDAALWLTFLLTEVGLLPMLDSNNGKCLMPGNVMSDAKSVTTALHTSRMPRERNLVPDLQRLRSLQDNGTAAFCHVGTDNMVADALTKPGKDSTVACEALSRLAQQNRLCVPAVHTRPPDIVAVAIDALPDPFVPLICPHFHVPIGL